jgi:HEAT repeat protein
MIPNNNDNHEITEKHGAQMDKKAKMEILQKLNEQNLTKKFLIPLFESMGYKNVTYQHGRLEFGKDLVCSEDDRFGRRIFTGIQVKATRLKTSTIDGIHRQIREAFGEPFTDLSDGKKQNLDRVIILTSCEFLDDAKKSLWASLRDSNLDKVVTDIDGEKIVDLLDKHLPSAFWDEYDFFKKYFEAMKSDFETIKDVSAIGQKEPIPLENIYVSLRVREKVPEREIPAFIGQKIFEDKLSNKKPEKVLEKARIINAEKAVKDYERLVILGVPGSGKTTLFKHFALHTCLENLQRQERICIPIPIILREFSDSKKSLREYIDDVFEKYQFPRAKEFIERDLKEGKCRLLLDGFDELAIKEKQDLVADKIHKFIEAYPKSQVIVTSRIAGYHDELKGFIKLELMDFDDNQIERFIENWFGKTNPGKAKSMQNAVDENEKIKAIARNPLMLTIIAIIYEEDRELPQKRAALYGRCLDVLLSRWDAQKRLKNVYPSEKKEFVLRKLAFYGHSNNTRVLTENEIIREISKYLPQLKLNQGDAKPLLDEIWQRSYLLRQISSESYDFLHLSFQEYFTALELRELTNGISIIIQHLPEPWWEEPVLLFAGISKEAATLTTLINRIKKEVNEDIFYSNLILFGKCIADSEFIEPDILKNVVNSLWSLQQTTHFSSLREKALEILVLIKPENIIDLLIEDLKNKDSTVRRRTIETLGRISSEKSVKLLIAALNKDKDNEVRWRAAIELGSLGREIAIQPLVNVLTANKSINVRTNAAFALGEIGSQVAIKPLIDALTTDMSVNVKMGAAYALGEIGSEVAIHHLNHILNTEKDSKVRGIVADALGSTRNEKTFDLLIDTLTNDTDSKVRGNAAFAIGRIGSDKDFEPIISAIAAEKESPVGRNTPDDLRIIRRENAFKVLMSSLTTDKDSYVRGSVVFALGRIDGEKAFDSIIEVLTTDKRSSVRSSAAIALGSIGNEKAFEKLVTTLTTDKSKRVRSSAADALARIGSERAIESLISILVIDKESVVRGSVADALGEMGNEKAIQPLINALSADKENTVRWRAAYALGKIGSEKSIQPLINSLSTDKESTVRVRAAYALGNIGSEKAIKSLEKSLKDEETWARGKVKDAAFTALENISRRTGKRITLDSIKT